MLRRITLAVLLPLALAACGGDGGPTSQPTASSTSASPSPTSASPSPSPSIPAPAELDAKLLVASDLGAGWTADGPDDSDDDEPATTTSGSPGACDFDQFTEEQVLRDRTVDLENGSTGTFVSHEIEIYEPGAATTTFQQIRDFLGRCKEISQTEDGEKFTMKLQPLTNVGTYGDESIGARISTTIAGQTFRGAIVVIRKGDFLSTIFGGSASGDATDVVRSAAQKAAAKLDL